MFGHGSEDDDDALTDDVERLRVGRLLQEVLQYRQQTRHQLLAVVVDDGQGRIQHGALHGRVTVAQT